jgi:hypothetical protein
MKQKRLRKKLTLNKKTIAGLDHLQISAVYGGCDSENSCPIPQTKDPTATVFPRHCPCCY